jgi:hypothetical protein
MEPRFKNVHIPRVALLAYFNHYAGGDNIALPVFKDAALYDLEGAYVVEIQNDPSTRSLLLTLWRKDWPEIPEGQVIPAEPGMYLMEEEVRQLVPLAIL